MTLLELGDLKRVCCAHAQVIDTSLWGAQENRLKKTPRGCLTRTCAAHKLRNVPNPDELVTTAEAADLLNVDRSIVIRHVQRGDLVPCQKLPGRTGAYLFVRADVQALAATRGAA